MPNRAHIQSGSMFRPVTIQKPVDSSDGAGGVIRSWPIFLQTWGNVVPNSGSESYFANQLYPKETYTIQIRYRNGLVPGMRLVMGTHTMRIREIIDLFDEHAILRLKCEELQAEGAIL